MPCRAVTQNSVLACMPCSALAVFSSAAILLSSMVCVHSGAEGTWGMGLAAGEGGVGSLSGRNKFNLIR